jgi:hypothetical protein
MNITIIITLLILYMLSYIYTYYIIQYISIYIYTSILTNIIIILFIDSYNIILERDNIYIDYIKLSKEMRLIAIENSKLHKLVSNQNTNTFLKIYK